MPLTHEHKYPAPPWHVEPPVKHEDEHSYGYMSYVIRNNEGVYVGEVHQYGEEFAVKAEATANYIISCASENATLRQQLEQKQGEVQWHKDETEARDETITELRQRVQELESESPTYKEICEVNQQTIAALTAKLAAVEEERDQWREVFERGCDDNKYLKQQLAAVQAQIKELETK